MTIKENKNLTYTIRPQGILALGEEHEIDTREMFLVSINRENKQTLKLNLKTKRNKKKAWIRAENLEGELFLDLLQEQLPKCVEKSYDEILNADFKKEAGRIPWTES